jgi:signal transduction histidine kinase
MSIRLKISILIALAGFLSGFIFSAWMMHEVIHEYTESVDHDLKMFSEEAGRAFFEGRPSEISEYDSNKYWMEIYESGKDTPVFRTELAKRLTIAKRSADRWNESVKVDSKAPYARQSRDGTSFFHMRMKELSHKGTVYVIYAGAPVEYMRGELIELTAGLAGGLVLALLLYFGGSYFLAGIILKPVRDINDSTKNITEKQLHMRLPFRKKGGDNDEFNELAKTLNGLFDRLENAFKRQKRLIADVSHELKTPLSVMRLAAEGLQRKLSAAGTGSADEDVRRLSDQVMRMDRLVRDILNLSALEMINSVGNASVDLTETISALAEDYRIIADSRGISIECVLDGGLFVRGDSEKLTRAFSNVLDNAVKYSDDGGLVQVSGRFGDSSIVIEVTNGGCVIPPQDTEKVFEEFYRVEQSRASGYGGAGLGLAIVKRTVELHGGKVTLENSDEKKTVVKIILPSV